MPLTRKQKEEILEQLVQSFKGAKSVFFTQYQGTNVKNMRLLRKQLLGARVNFKVAKKTLMALAAKKNGHEEIPKSLMQGPIGLAFGMGDEVAPAKIIHDFAKTAETVKLVGGFFEGKFIEAADAKVLAMLPGREVLLAKLVGSMKAPIFGFYGVLHGLLRNFVYAMAEVQKKKSA